jgi:uncharacterized lipoprotein YddW (UPF0748 family)
VRSDLRARDRAQARNLHAPRKEEVRMKKHTVCVLSWMVLSAGCSSDYDVESRESAIVLLASRRVHSGGTIPFIALPKGVLTLERADGTPVSDGSLGTITQEGTRPWLYHYRAPTRVPAEGRVVLRSRVHPRVPFSHTYAIEITEGRATYLRPFDPFAREPSGSTVPVLGALSKADRENPIAGRARIAAELDRTRAAGFNTILVEAYFHGYTLWPTTVARQRPSTLAGGIAVYSGNDPVRGTVLSSWDPLAVYLEEAHARGIEVHAWLESFYVWTRFFQSGQARVPSNASWLWSLHPDWFNKKREVPGVNAAGEVVSVAEDGKFFLDPAHADVQTYNRALIDELLVNYPTLDGIQLDYIRHPIHRSGTAPSWYGTGLYHDFFGFNPVTFAAFTAETGYTEADLDPTSPVGPAWDAFTDWKIRGVTQLVRDTTTRIRATNERVTLSVSVFPDFVEERKKMQDVAGWVDEGLVDVVMPQLYYTTYQRVLEVGDPFLDLLRRRVLVYPTFFISHFYDHATGSYRPGGFDYLSYAANRDVEGTALFIQSGTTTGVSADLAADLTGSGAPYEHAARSSHR